MRKDTIKITVSILVIATHALSFFVIVALRQAYFRPDIRLNLALTLIPVTATYFSAIVRDAIETQKNTDVGAIVTLNYAVVTLVTTTLFCLSLLYFVFWFPEAGGPRPEDLQRWLVIVEIAFGAAFGLIAQDLFGKIEKVERPIKPDPASPTAP